MRLDLASDPTAHTAWGFPGMDFLVEVENPAGYAGLKQVSYTSSVPVLTTRDQATDYTKDIGQYALGSTAQSEPYPYSRSQESDFLSFACPKDPGTITIDVTAQVWKWSSGSGTPTFDTLTDAVIVKVEAPTVNSFQVSNDSAAGDPASPFWFGQTDGSLVPGASGNYMTFMMAGGSPLAEDRVGFWADVTNNTHYDLHIGVIQTVDFSIYRAYTDGSSDGASGNDDLDTVRQWPDYWYQPLNTYRLNSGVTGTFSANQLPWDSPIGPAPVAEGSGFLQVSNFHAQFETHLAVAGGWNPNLATSVSGFPIALSTAQWHLDGEATNNANSTNPGAATFTTTTTMANWTVSTASPSGPWTSSGDGVSKYITYDGDSYTDLGGLASDVALARPEIGSALGRQKAYDHWDRAIALLGPVFLQNTHPESQESGYEVPHRGTSLFVSHPAVALLWGTQSDPSRAPDRHGPLQLGRWRPIRLV